MISSERLILENIILNVQQFFFNIILRSSILYGSETYYNLTEKEIRIIERIEEQFLRKLFKTTKACPISQLYLEAGHYPARFEIFKRRLLFFKDILNEKPGSLIQRFVQLQLEKPIKGDWASSCLKSLDYLKLNYSIEEIKEMNKTQFKKILKMSIQEKSLQYLLNKRGSKGKEMQYSSLKMAEYLLPQNENLSITDQQYIFSIRNRMVEIDYNFSNKKNEKYCVCDAKEDMKHIYYCKKLNSEDVKQNFEKIFEENVKTQRIVLERFRKNFEKRDCHGILNVDPLYSTVMEIN